MDKAHIVKLARARHRAQSRVTALAMQNTYGLNPEQQVARGAQYILASDARDRAVTEYNVAIQSLSADQLRELACFVGTEITGDQTKDEME